MMGVRGSLGLVWSGTLDGTGDMDMDMNRNINIELVNSLMACH